MKRSPEWFVCVVYSPGFVLDEATRPCFLVWRREGMSHPSGFVEFPSRERLLAEGPAEIIGHWEAAGLRLADVTAAVDDRALGDALLANGLRSLRLLQPAIAKGFREEFARMLVGEESEHSSSS